MTTKTTTRGINKMKTPTTTRNYVQEKNETLISKAIAKKNNENNTRRRENLKYGKKSKIASRRKDKKQICQSRDKPGYQGSKHDIDALYET